MGLGPGLLHVSCSIPPLSLNGSSFFFSSLFSCMCSSCRVNVISRGMSESKQIAQESRNHMDRFVVYHVYLSVPLSVCLSVCQSILPFCLCVLFACLYIFFFCLICTVLVQFLKFNLLCIIGVVFSFFVMGFLDFDSTAYIYIIFINTHTQLY